MFVGSIVGKDYNILFWNAKDFERILATDQRFRGSFICATNLGFDLGAIFEAFNLVKKLSPIERSGGVVYAFVYATYNNKDYNIYSKSDRDNLITENKYNKKDFYKITFIDSISHLGASLSQLGKIVKHDKIKSPDFLGFFPRTYEQISELIRYNLNDSYVTYLFMSWLQKEYNKLGCNLRVTISSTALDLFRRKYLKSTWEQENKKISEICYKAYYGGRTEIFKRGVFGNPRIKSYDVNSLYPYIMKESRFPKPEGIYKKNINYNDLKLFDGVVKASLECPETLTIPFLPVRLDKLYFPTGLICGYYSFVELRYALNLKYKILKLGEGVVYHNSFSPFKKIITDLYNYRMKRKKAKDSTHLVPKILMNSLYGKFGYNYTNKDMIIHGSELTPKIIKQSSQIVPYPNKEYFRIRSSERSTKPNYVYPVLSLYVTANARIHMYKEFKKVGFDRVYYSDTDCIFTTRTLKVSGDLGALKLENDFINCCLIKPKMYSGKTQKGDLVKIKGLKKSIKSYDEFIINASDGNISATITNFRKLRSSLTTNKKVNETFQMYNEFDLEDSKRIWERKTFDFAPQNSKPLHFTKETYEKFK